MTCTWERAAVSTFALLGGGACAPANGDRSSPPGEFATGPDASEDPAPCSRPEAGGGPRYRDADGDGFGAGEPSWGGCVELGEGWVARDGDCDDANPHVTPAVWQPDRGAPIDLSAHLLGDPDQGPVPVALDVAGKLTLCPGIWPAALTVTAPVEIGAWRPGVVLSGAGSHTPVTVAGRRGHATLRGITVADGRATSAVLTRAGSRLGGGGIHCDDGARLTLRRVTLRDNQAEVGGGIFAGPECALSLRHTTITGNRASSSGGGLSLQDATVTAAAGAISGNRAPRGGGIEATGGAIDLDATHLRGNRAAVGAGGLEAHGTTTQLTDLEVSDNLGATTGGLFAFQGALDLLRVRIADNVAAAGAPVGAGGGIRADAARVVLNDSEVIGNRSAANGGGIAADLAAHVSLLRTHVLDNRAFGEGGGVSLGGAADGVVEGVWIEHNAARIGGGIAAVGADTTLSLVDAALVENQAIDGGGLWVDGATTVLDHVEVARNGAAATGGGLAYAAGDATLRDVIADDNQARQGGGICVGDTHLIATGLTASGNRAIETGGALHLEPSAVVSLTRLDATDNSAGLGGGVFVEDRAELQLTESVVRANRPDDVRHVMGGEWTVEGDGTLLCAGHTCD